MCTQTHRRVADSRSTITSDAPTVAETPIVVLGGSELGRSRPNVPIAVIATIAYYSYNSNNNSYHRYDSAALRPRRDPDASPAPATAVPSGQAVGTNDLSEQGSARPTRARTLRAPGGRARSCAVKGLLNGVFSMLLPCFAFQLCLLHARTKPELVCLRNTLAFLRYYIHSAPTSVGKAAVAPHLLVLSATVAAAHSCPCYYPCSCDMPSSRRSYGSCCCWRHR